MSKTFRIEDGTPRTFHPAPGCVSSAWYAATTLGAQCDGWTHCLDCKPDGDCESCDSIDGRWIQAVCEYASTCDGCGELTLHEAMQMDDETQLGYCATCQEPIPHNA